MRDEGVGEGVGGFFSVGCFLLVNSWTWAGTVFGVFVSFCLGGWSGKVLLHTCSLRWRGIREEGSMCAYMIIFL